MNDILGSAIWYLSFIFLLSVGGFLVSALVVWLVMRRRYGQKPASAWGIVMVMVIMSVTITLMQQLDIGDFGLAYIFATLIAAGLQMAGVFTVSLILRERYKESDV